MELDFQVFAFDHGSLHDEIDEYASWSGAILHHTTLVVAMELIQLQELLTLVEAVAVEDTRLMVTFKVQYQEQAVLV